MPACGVWGVGCGEGEERQVKLPAVMHEGLVEEEG